MRPLLLKKKNKKGQFETKLLAVVLIFVIGIIIFFMNHMNKQIYDALDVYLEGEPEYNDTTAHRTLQDIQSLEASNMWDWVFLAFFFGVIIAMVLFSYATRINIVFFWVYVITALIILFAGVLMSNIWQDFVTNDEFADTILRFPIMNFILGTYFPTIIVFIIFLGIIILFGKPPTESLG